MQNKLTISKITYKLSLQSETMGFSTVPDKLRSSSKEKGFSINILVVGRRGLGTTTFINSLFHLPLISEDRSNGLTIMRNQILENDTFLNICITTFHKDTLEILDYVNDQYDDYYCNEHSMKRVFFDKRIHLCFYLLPQDTIFEQELIQMKELSKIVNLIPIITKSDCFTVEELIKYKSFVKRVLDRNEILQFKPRIYDEDDRELYDDLIATINNFPLAIFASTKEFDYHGKMKYGRLYHYGFLDIEDEQISDFLKLKRMILQTQLDELIYQTDAVFYNNYRGSRMLKEKTDRNIMLDRMMKIKKEMIEIIKQKNEARVSALEEECSHLRKLLSEFEEDVEIISYDTIEKSPSKESIING